MLASGNFEQKPIGHFLQNEGKTLFFHFLSVIFHCGGGDTGWTYVFSHAGSGWSAVESTDYNFVSAENNVIIAFDYV